MFDELCNEELLRKCLLGATQNRNESFTNLIWATKDYILHHILQGNEIVVSHAAIVFNSGRQGLISFMDRLKMNPGPLCTAHLASQDSTRIKRSQASNPAVAKQQRKSKRVAEKEAEEAHIVREGTTYAAGGF